MSESSLDTKNNILTGIQVKSEDIPISHVVNLVDDVLSKSIDDESDNDEDTNYYDNSRDESQIAHEIVQSEIDLDEWKIRFGEFHLWMRINKKMPHPCNPNTIEQEMYTFCSEQWKNREILDHSLISLLESTDNWFWGNATEKIDQPKSDEINWEILYGSFAMWTKLNNRMPYPHATDNMENEQFAFCNHQWLHRDDMTITKKVKLESISVWFWGIPFKTSPLTERNQRYIIRTSRDVVEPERSDARNIAKPVKSLKERTPTFAEKQKIKTRNQRTAK